MRGVRRLIVLGGPFPREEVLDDPEVEVGRSAGVGLVLGDGSVSRRHARLVEKAEGIVVEDRGSTFGTYINDRRLPPGEPAVLHDGDVIRFGHVPVVCRFDEEPADPDRALRDAVFVARANARLVLLEDGRTRRCPLAEPTTRIGSAPDCEVRLLDPDGPPEEAKIIAVEGAFRIEGRCPARPPRLGDLPLLPGRPEPLPSNSVIVLRRVQGLFLHDFDGEGRPVPDPLAAIPRRRLLHVAAEKTGLPLRLIRRLAGGRRSSGRALGEVLVEKGIVTPLLWMSLAADLPRRSGAGRRIALLEKLMDLFRASSSRIPLLLFLLFLAVLPGCGWVPALVGVIAASGGDGSDGIPDPPAFETRPSGSFLALDGGPTAIALGDFVPDPGNCLDGAIIFEGERMVSFLEGDGTGRLSPAGGLGVSLNGELPVRLGSVPAPSGGEPGRLLVATSNTLEHVVWADGKPQASFAVLGGRPDLARDLAAGDFDGDGLLEAAVSSFANGWVEIFDLPRDGGDPIRLDVLKLPYPPDSIAAAPYLGGGPCCLAVLAEKGGIRTILFFCPRDGAWCPQPDAELDLVNAGTLELAKEVFDLNSDGFPDIAYAKPDGTGTVFVKPPKSYAGGPIPGCGGLSGWSLKEQGRGGSHYSPAPAGIAIIHLPGGVAETADRITIDRSLGSIICSYFVPGGKDFSRAVSYSLPGEGIAMAPGDLNGDGLTDLAAISGEAGRSFLTVLLANPPGEDVREDPFSYLSGSRSGEVSISEPNLIDVTSGRCGPGGMEPFLAAIDRTNEEVTVFFMGLRDGAPVILRLERYDGFGTTPGGILARDMDLDGDDDIVVMANDGYHILRNEGGSATGEPRFEKEPEVGVGDLTLDASAYRLREHVCAGQVDGTGGLDLVIPINPYGDGADLIAVVLDAGSPNRSTTLRPSESPRQVTIAKLNDDDAPDLLVACDDLNKIQIIEGIPGSPGTFRPPPHRFLEGRIGSLVPGLREVRSTNDPLLAAGIPFADWPVAEWLVASNSPGVTLYCRQEEPDGGYEYVTRLDMPQLYSGIDPEAILVTDLFGNGGLDLAVTDENQDQIIFLRDLGASEGICRAWLKQDEPAVISPQHFATLNLDGSFFLAVASRADQAIQVFGRRSPVTLALESSIPLLPEDIPGSPAGLAAARTAAGGLLVAALVEDAEEAGLIPSVDLMGFPRAPAGAYLPERERIELVGEIQPTAVLLADVDGDGAIDLLTYDEETRSLGWHKGSEAAGGPTVRPEREPGSLLDLEGSEPLVAAHLAPTDGSSLWVALASEGEARLCSIDRRKAAGRLEWVSRERSGPILGIAPGRAGPGKDPRRDLWVAVLEPRRLVVELVTGEIAEVIPEGNAESLAAVGAGDVNGDGRDDLAVVEGGTLLRVFRASGGAPAASFPEDLRASMSFPRYIEPVELVFLDSNGDGKVDIAVGTKAGDVYIFQGNGLGTFADQGSVFAAPGTEGIHAVDLDEDGRDEIFAAAPVPGLIVLPGR